MLEIVLEVIAEIADAVIDYLINKFTGKKKTNSQKKVSSVNE